MIGVATEILTDQCPFPHEDAEVGHEDAERPVLTDVRIPLARIRNDGDRLASLLPMVCGILASPGAIAEPGKGIGIYDQPSPPGEL